MLKLTPSASCYLLPMLVWTLSGCATSGVAGDDYELVANPPGLESHPPKVTKSEDRTSTTTLYKWSDPVEHWPNAVIVFTRIKDIYRGNVTYVRSKSMPQLINAYLPNLNIDLGSPGTTRNAVGEVTLQRFSVEDAADCVFIEQTIDRFADQVELSSGREPIGDMTVRGWYCTMPWIQGQYELFTDFIQSIGIRGYAVP